MTGQRAWAVGLVLLLGGVCAPASPDLVEITKFVHQLGSGKFVEREAATQALSTIGPPALDALRSAQRSDDAEVRRRADELVRTITKRVEAERILQPTRVRLCFKDTPVTNALDDLAKRLGYAIEFQGDRRKLAERLLTLETPELSFWEAFDLFCAKAELTQPTPELRSARAGREFDPIQARAQMDLLMRRQAAGQPTATEAKLIVVDGKPTPRPTAYAGAVRLRLKPVGSASPTDGEITLGLEMASEPKLAWNTPLGVRLERVVDDKDRRFVLIAGDEVLATNLDAEAALWQRNMMAGQRRQVQFQVQGGAGQQIVIQNGVLMSGTNLCEAVPPLSIRLRPPDEHTKTIKQLKAALACQVLTPPEPVITVDDVLESAGKSYVHEDVGELRVCRVTRLENGGVDLLVQLIGPAANGAAGMFLNGPPAGQVVFGGGSAAGVQNPGLMVEDDKGQPFKLARAPNVSYISNPNGVSTRQYGFQFLPPTPSTAPKKLVYSSSRLTVIDVPFEFRDVTAP